MKTRSQNPFDYFDRIYYINLDRRTDRRVLAEEEFRSVGLTDVQRVTGTEHEIPAMGCHLSHSKVFYDAMQEGYDRILIFEDDVQFFPNALGNFYLALNSLPGDWDMFYLGANLDRYLAYEVTPYLAKLTGAFATHAYAVRRTLFSLLYDININNDTIHNDVTYSQIIHPTFNCYLAMPLVAGQREDYSDIQRTFMASNQVFVERLERNLVRK